MATLLLLHPPLPGPSVWGPAAEALAAAGHRAVVPDLRPAVDPPADPGDARAALRTHRLRPRVRRDPPGVALVATVVLLPATPRPAQRPAQRSSR